MESRPVEIRDGDIVQLGVDYQGGLNEIYRAVKMRFEINQTPQSNSFNVSAFNNLRQFTASSLVDPQTATCSDAHMTDKSCISNSDNSAAGGGEFQVDECCICLYALAPLQALFVAPCSHSYHFKCIRPLLQSYPGFQCPICRTYSDLEASVAIEPEEVAEKFGLQTGKQADRILDETNNETHQEQRHPLQQAQTTTTTPSPSAAAAETASSPPPPPPLVDTTAGVASNLLDDTLVLSPTNLSTGSEGTALTKPPFPDVIVVLTQFPSRIAYRPTASYHYARWAICTATATRSAAATTTAAAADYSQPGYADSRAKVKSCKSGWQAQDGIQR